MGRLLSCAFPACPIRRPSFTLANTPRDGQDDGGCEGAGVWGGGGGRGEGGARAVGISALPWTAHVCSQQAAVLPGRKYLSGEELAQDRSDILTTNTDTTYKLLIMAEVQHITSQTNFLVVGVVASFLDLGRLVKKNFIWDCWCCDQSQHV